MIENATGPDFLDLILQNGTPIDDAGLRREISRRVSAVLATRGRGSANHVSLAETFVRSEPASAFEMDASGTASLTVDGNKWHAGRFEVFSLADLRARVAQRQLPRTVPQVRLWVLDGNFPVKDIGALQATCGRNTLFQVASQFNCLESPGAFVTPVARYFSDPTQGPRASISAFPATLLRHYRAPAPDGSRFVQETDGQQIDLLSGACGRRVSRNGYFTGEGIDDIPAVLAALESRFDSICVGVHDDAQVVLGYEWDGSVESSAPPIAQVFTSTAAGGSYRAPQHLGAEGFHIACRQLLRAAYLGTLLAAAALERDRIVLTLIGGGVFQNPITAIWDAIEWSLEEVKPYLSRDIDVIVNGFTLRTAISQTGADADAFLLQAVRRHGGAVLTFDSAGLLTMKRAEDLAPRHRRDPRGSRTQDQRTQPGETVRPIENSYALPLGGGFAGQYPGDADEAVARQKLRQILGAGVTVFLDLTEPGERTWQGPMKPYAHLLEEEAANLGVSASHKRIAIPDQRVPRTHQDTLSLFDVLDQARRDGTQVYLHCWGGKGRTGTMVACHLVHRGYDAEEALRIVQDLASTMPKARGASVPENELQRSYVRDWHLNNPRGREKA
jgi:Protein-tyrosine phosphatase